MEQIIAEHLSQILSFAAGVLSGSFVTFKLARNTAARGGSVIDQSRAQAGGDIVGGSKTNGTH